jgi:hypothetical protein
MMLLDGPICGLVIAIPAVLTGIGRPDFDVVLAIWMISVLYVMGMVAGLIADEIWRAYTRVPEAEEMGGIWDDELDGPP